MTGETVTRWICPKCGSDNIETDLEDGEYMKCLECGHRFLSEIPVPDEPKWDDEYPEFDEELEEEEDFPIVDGWDDDSDW